MKICWFGFLGKNMSWSLVGQNICRQLIKKNHEVDLFSTNGNSKFPEDLKPYLKGCVEEDVRVTTENYNKCIGKNLKDTYDMQLSYTALKNFPYYFSRGTTNRFGIWNYETTILPSGFAKYSNYVDKILPSSNFSKNIFSSNGIKEDKQVVIPHGIEIEKYEDKSIYPLRTKKKYKILANIAQPHLRKNIPALLKSFGLAFNKADDVCLVIKISKKKPVNAFDVDFELLLSDFKKAFKDHAEIEIIDQFLPNIEPVYRACDIVFTMSHAECFWMPGLEGFAANKLVIAPKYGGQLDYMNSDNSILIGGKEIRADWRMQYWEPSPYAKVFDPDINEATNCLKEAVKNYQDYLNKFQNPMRDVVQQHSWEKVADKILGLCH